MGDQRRLKLWHKKKNNYYLKAFVGLPYRVRCKCTNGLGGGKADKGVLKFIGNCNGVISNYYEDILIDSGFVNDVFYPIENIKPFLRPMSGMTEEERVEYNIIKYPICPENADDYAGLIDWLNAHHSTAVD